MTLEIFNGLTKNTTIVITVSILATEVIWQLYKKYKCFEKKVVMSRNCTKQLNKNTEDQAKISEVMFFSKDSTLCRISMKPCERPHCAVKHLRKIIEYFDSAINTVDICIYFFTCPLLTNAVINAHKRGVVIRMIMDETMLSYSKSKIVNFYEAGIIPKSKLSDVLMHHKFAIIDNSILITGSINWTRSAFFGNFENMLITNEFALVEPYIIEFNRLWTVFNATNISVVTN